MSAAADHAPDKEAAPAEGPGAANKPQSTPTHARCPPGLWWFVPCEWRSWWHLACAAALVTAAALYLGSLRGEFVWDDHYLVGGEGIGGGESLLRCLTEPFLSHYFRPLVSVSFFLDRRVFGGNAAGYHLVNVVVHVLGTLAVLGLLREALGRRWAVPLGALVFAAHPVHVGAVAWIGGRTDAMAVLLVATSGYGLVRAAGSPHGGGWLALSVASYTLALFTKEQCLALLPLVPLTYACFPVERGVRLPGTGWVALLPFVVASALFVALGFYLGMPQTRGTADGTLGLLEQVGQTLTYYVLLTFAPTAKWMHTTSLGPMLRAGWPAVAGGLLAAGIAVLLWVHLMRTYRPAAWFLAHAALLLGPVSNIVPLPYLQAVPYRGALSGIGMAALLGLLLEWLVVTWPAMTTRPAARAGARLAAVAAVAAYVAWLGGLTVAGAQVWRSERGVFAQFLAADPDCIAITYTLAAIELFEKDDANGARHLARTLDLLFGRDNWRTPDGVRRTFGPRVLRAARQNQGMDAPPHLWVASLFTQLGFARLRLADSLGAELTFLAGLEVDRRNPDLYAGVAAVASAERRYDTALAWYARAIPLITGPQHAYIYAETGRIHAEHGRFDRAIDLYTRWSKAVPESPEPRVHLADALARARRIDDAVAIIQEALRLDPKHARARQMLGWMEEVRAQQGPAR